MPRNVRRFAWLWGISALIGFAELAFMPSPPSSSIQMGFTAQIQLVFSFVLLTAILLLLLPFFWLAVWRRKNWARWLLFILFLISIPLLFLDREQFGPDHLFFTLVGFAGTLIEAAAFFFIFTGDAGPWFKQEL